MLGACPAAPLAARRARGSGRGALDHMGDRIRKPFVALGAVLVLATAGLPGGARTQTVIGGSGEPSVSVDMSVLDSLGPPPTVPDLLMPNRARTAPPAPARGGRLVLTPIGPEAGTERVHLHPPSDKRPLARRAPVRHRVPAKTATRPTAKTVPSQVARRAFEPIAPPPPPTMTAPTAPAPAPAMNAPEPPPMTAPKAPEPPKAASAAPLASPPPAPPPMAAPSVSEPLAPPPAAEKPSAPPPPPPSPAQTASLGAAASTGQVSLPFGAGSAALGDDTKAALDSIASRADKDSSLRLQLLAYASGTGDTASRARRLSLSRALAVRSYLIDKGVRSTRIDVRALGNRLPGGGSADRVDVVVSHR